MARPMLPDVWVNLRDGALGIQPPPSESVSAKIGVATQGPADEVLSLTGVQQVKEVLGGGPLAEASAVHLAVSGASLYVVRLPGSVTAQDVPMAQKGSGSGEIRITAQGNDGLKVLVTIPTSPAGAFVYSLDGGGTFSAPMAIPYTGEFRIPEAGVTLRFVGGASVFKAGDSFYYELQPSGYTLIELIKALDTLLQSPYEFSWVHIVGSVNPTIASAVAAKMREAETRHRFAFALLEEPAGSPPAEWDNFADTRVAVAAGMAEIPSPLTGCVVPRSVAWLASAKMASIPPHEHAGRIASGPVPGVVRLLHDEAVSPGADGRGFITMRSVIGRRGFYFTRGRMKAPQGSDYQFIENRRVMDLACRLARNSALQFLNDAIRVDDAGAIAEADARAIEAYVEGTLISGVVSPGYASDVQVRLKRDSNVLSTRSTVMTIRVRPRGYLEYIEMDIGFDNPALRARE